MKLAVSKISKSYNKDTVLRDCSITFDNSGIYVLMGPNGSGKSTFLRICALLEEPDAGEVRYSLNGAALDKNAGLKQKITLMLPGVGVFNTTVFENVAYGLRLRGMGKEDINRKAGQALDLVNLKHKTGHNALTLSSGETQRLGIARALVIEPEILFLDEPTASIDDKNTEIIEDVILKMKNEGKPTVIMATHDIQQAERLGKRILFIREGRILETS